MREKENHPLINKHMHCLNHSDALNERQMQMYMTWENEMLRVEGKKWEKFLLIDKMAGKSNNINKQHIHPSFTNPISTHHASNLPPNVSVYIT